MIYSTLLAVVLATLSSSVSGELAPEYRSAPKAYVTGEIIVKDPKAYEDYKAAIASTAARFGGRYLVRGGKVETIEGDSPRGRVVIIEFDSFEKAMAFEHAPETLAASSIRHRAAQSRLFVVEGAPQ